MYRQIILRSLEKPKEANIQQDIRWMCESLGLLAGRDVERMSFQVMESLLRGVAEKSAVSAEDIASDLEVAAQRVNYHVRTLCDTGLIYRERRLIHLREGSVRSAIEEMRKDANRIFDSLLSMAEDIDHSLGLKNRPK